eukprot:XP_001692155.1 predicted protein [Chlamydomonas reinhardtii]
MEHTVALLCKVLRQTEYGVYKELLHYLQEMEKTPAVDCNEAVKKQALPTSAALGLAPWDLMHELETIPARIKFLNDLYRDVCTNASGVPGPGMQVAFQGRDEATYRALLQLAPLLDMAWLEHAARDDWGRRPGNWRLMSKQGYCGNIAFERARRDGMNWMAHIDADELLIPSVSLAAELAAAPAWAGYLKMHNHEAVIESFEVVNKYEEVTLFKTHDQTLPNRTSDIQWRFRLGTYGTFYQKCHVYKDVDRLKQLLVRDRIYSRVTGPQQLLRAQGGLLPHSPPRPVWLVMTP